MGSARWDPGAWATHSSATRSMPAHEIFKSTSIDKDLDPKNIKVRESLDSKKNPKSTPIIVAVDDTGSMGILAETIIKTGLGTIMEEVYGRKPVTDPHLMCMAVGDSYCDQHPLQVTQFEASMALADQVKKFFIEQGGGGNYGESYLLAWYFAAMKTKCDALMKRKRKGYLFTVGDECCLPELPKDHIKKIFGDGAQSGMSSKALLETVSQGWEVFHLIVKPVPYQTVVKNWRDLLHERAIEVGDHKRLAEVIVSTMQVIEGHDVDEVVHSWSGDTAVVVADSVRSLAKRGAEAGVHRL